MEEFKDFLFRKLQEFERTAGHRVTIQNFADYLGVSRPTVSFWLDGKIKPSYSNVELIAEKLGPEVYMVLGYSAPDPALKFIESQWEYVSTETKNIILKIISDSTNEVYETKKEKPSNT